MTKKKESESYREMLEEVELVVKTVGSPEVDLDEMVKEVERGYGLIKTMRGRLEETKKKIELLRLEFD